MIAAGIMSIEVIQMATHGKVSKTQQRIKEAFIYLIHTKGFERLTISDITQYAHINRSTFYAHYQDKFDLIHQYEQKFLTALRDIISNRLAAAMVAPNNGPETMVTYDAVRKMLDYIAADFDLVKALISPGGDPQVVNEMKKMLREIIDADLYQVKGNTKMTTVIPDNYAHEIVVGDIVNIVTFWLSQDNPDSPEAVAEIIMKTRFMSPYQLLGIPQ
jgi:AcrR family transcriptional regulator